MGGLLLKILIGAAIGGAAIGAGVAIYNYVSKQRLEETVKEEAANNELLKKAFAAKVREKSSQAVTIDFFDDLDSDSMSTTTYTADELGADEIGDEISEGDLFILRDF